MEPIIREFCYEDLPEMLIIWNEIVQEGVAFPQEEALTSQTGLAFFSGQSFCGVAEDRESEKILGLYIFHPNNIGGSVNLTFFALLI